MKITAEMLQANGAGEEQIQRFERIWPDGVEISVDEARRLLPASVWDEYKRAKAEAWEEYKRVRDPAIAEYNEVQIAAWDKYVKLTDPALAEYNRMRDAALVTALASIEEWRVL